MQITMTDDETKSEHDQKTFTGSVRITISPSLIKSKVTEEILSKMSDWNGVSRPTAPLYVNGFLEGLCFVRGFDSEQEFGSCADGAADVISSSLPAERLSLFFLFLHSEPSEYAAWEAIRMRPSGSA